MTNVLIITFLILIPTLSPKTLQYPPSEQPQFSLTGDPLGHFEGTGAPGSLSWTGDGQQISNPSFETGTLAPWLQIQRLTANGSAVSITSPGYLSSKSAQLTVYSGNSSSLNLIQDSHIGLTDDLTEQKLGFTPAIRFRTAVLIRAMTGATNSDRVEASLALTTSIGGVRTIHYVFADGSSLPTNRTTDAYLKIPGFDTIGQWITIDRDLAADAAAAFPGDYPSIDSVQSVTLQAYAQTIPGPALVDPKIKFWNSANFGFWANGEPVVYDTNNNGVYDSGDLVIGCGIGNSCSPPPANTPLIRDPKIKFVDSNHNNIWDPGESVVYDNDPLTTSGDGVFDYRDTVIAPPTPTFDTLLMKVVQRFTQSLFDQVELYTATGGYDWIRNGGFEAGLAGWYTNSTFTTTTSPVHSGSQSAKGTITSGAAEMAQSIDARPLVDSTMAFKASANIGTMTGTSSSDSADLWLVLVDGQGNPLSLYYYFKTGDGTIPTNRTDTIYLKTNGFGLTGQWLNINVGLLQLVQAAVSQNSLPYSTPYYIELVVLEARASPSKTTTVYFDDLSLGNPTHSGTAPSYFYGVDGLNSTTVYTAASIPQGAFSLDIPQGRALVNVTSPEGSALQPGDYTTSVSSGLRRIDVLDRASFKHSPLGTWKIFTTSTNAIASVYSEDPASHTPESGVGVGSTANLVSQTKDPFGQPILAVSVNLTLWNTSSGAPLGSWMGLTNSQGWWNVSSVTLPLSGTAPGVYSLQAAVSSVYPGIRIFQVSVRYTVSVSLSLSSPQASAGSSIMISGTLIRADTSTPAPGVNVTISYRLAGNSEWTVLGTVKTDASGRYSYTWNPPEGEYEVRATTGDTTTAPAQSTPTQLLVGAPGLLQGPWLWAVVAVVAAAVVTLGAIVFLRKKGKPSPKK